MRDNTSDVAIGSHKEAALSFLRMVVTSQVRPAFDQFVTDDFVHHNPYFRGDARSLMAAMEQNGAENPQKIFEVKHVVEEDDLVVVHGRVRMNPDAIDIALVHIFRFDGDRIAELWDVGQPMPENSPNEHGMF